MLNESLFSKLENYEDLTPEEGTYLIDYFYVDKIERNGSTIYIIDDENMSSPRGIEFNRKFNVWSPVRVTTKTIKKEIWVTY